MIYTKSDVKSLDLSRLLEEIISSGEPHKTLFLVPTNRLARNLKKKIISRMPHKSVSVINIETLTTLSLKILADKMTFRELSDAGAAVMIKHVTGGLKLRYFQNYKGHFPDGTLDRIRNVIGEYKEHGITPGLLRKEAESLEGSEKLKALDIADIYERYNKKNSDLKVYELGDIYANINNMEDRNIHGAFRELFPEVSTIFVAGFDEFTLPEAQILNSISGITGIDTWIDFDYYRYNPMIFSHLEKTANMLEMLEFRRAEDLSKDTSGGFITEVRERLFLNKGKPTDRFSAKIDVIKAFNKSEEVELIASGIKELLTTGDVKPHQICVAFNLVSDYTEQVREKFELFGLPANITDRPNVDSSYPVIALINFFEIIENNYYFKNILRALNSGFLSLDSINAENLKRTASELKIVSGKESWINKIKTELYSLENNSEDFRSGRRINSLNKALEDFKKLEKLLSPFEKKLTPAEFSKYFLETVTRLKIRENLIAESFGLEEENIKAFTAFLETVNEIMKLVELEYGKSGSFSSEFYLESIKTAASRSRYNVKERPEYGVLVTNINEIRGLSFDYLFIGGMNDGVFPTRFQPEIFLSGSYKKAEITHQTEERFHFYQAMKVWKKHLWLASSFSDGKRELVESSFLKDFMSLFVTGEITSEKYRDFIFTKKRVQIAAGNNEAGIEEELGQIFGKNFRNFISKSRDIHKVRSANVLNESPFNGFISDESPELRQNLESYGDKQYSVSRLENYAKCPFKFFLDSVLNIEIVEEPTEEVEAMELGTIFHEIFYRFLTFAKKQGLTIRGCDTGTFRKLEEKLFEIAEDEITKMGMDTPLSFSERERITGFNGKRHESVLYRFLEYERDSTDAPEPAYFEVSFGSTSRESTDEDISRSEPVEAAGVKLRGKIDRIDIDNSTRTYDIVDYKLSGKKPTLPELQNGISLQLPVYLFAAKSILAKAGLELTPGEMIIYSLKYSEKNFGRDPVKLSRKKEYDSDALNEEIIEIALGFIKEYVGNITAGRFNLSKFENRESLVCGYCNYKPVCRVADLKEEN